MPSNMVPHTHDSKYRQLLSNMTLQREIAFVDYYVTPKEIYFTVFGAGLAFNYNRV